MQDKQTKRTQRHRRITAKIKGTKTCPRLAVFRSGRHIYVQLVDDTARRAIFGLSSQKISAKDQKAGRLEIAKKLGAAAAKEAIKRKITKVVFDRGGYKYHGRVKALAEGARAGGLKF